MSLQVHVGLAARRHDAGLVGAGRPTLQALRQFADRPFGARDVALHDVPQLKVTISIGVHTRGAGAASVAELIDRADQALYRSKRTGRNRVSMFAGPQAASLVL